MTFGASSTFRRLIVSEYSGAATTSPVDATASNLAAGTTTPNGITSGTAGTTQSGDLIYGGVIDVLSTNDITAGTGYTQYATLNGSDTTNEYADQLAPTTTAATWSFSNTDNYVAIMVAFKKASSSVISDINANSLFTLSQNGSAIFKNYVNSASAFVVQNATGTAEFTIDTSGDAITIGSGNTNITLYGNVTSGTISAIQPGTSETAETWHNLTVPSGWTDKSGNGTGFRYRLEPDGTVLLSINVSAPSTAPGTITMATLPTGYIPISGQNIPLASSSNTGSGQSPHLFIDTSGNIKCYGINASAVVSGNGIIILN